MEDVIGAVLKAALKNEGSDDLGPGTQFEVPRVAGAGIPVGGNVHRCRFVSEALEWEWVWRPVDFRDQRQTVLECPGRGTSVPDRSKLWVHASHSVVVGLRLFRPPSSSRVQMPSNGKRPEGSMWQWRGTASLGKATARNFAGLWPTPWAGCGCQDREESRRDGSCLRSVSRGSCEDASSGLLREVDRWVVGTHDATSWRQQSCSPLRWQFFGFSQDGKPAPQGCLLPWWVGHGGAPRTRAAAQRDFNPANDEYAGRARATLCRLYIHVCAGSRFGQELRANAFSDFSTPPA